MTSFDACSEADWMMETIIDDFAQTLALPDRARFYARLVELLNERYKVVQQSLNQDGPPPDSKEKVH